MILRLLKDGKKIVKKKYRIDNRVRRIRRFKKLKNRSSLTRRLFKQKKNIDKILLVILIILKINFFDEMGRAYII